jgi:hypothetical protein
MIGELARDSFRAATRGWDFDKSTKTVKFVMTWLSRRKIGRLATLVELGKSDTDSLSLKLVFSAAPTGVDDDSVFSARL